ncbi:hypothetical protein DFH08DRAFT_1022809 [Mycena albidolilacea]|uniref:DUF6534 domain-containing protein n=1 Tax=Mycena albidolilacea TaxID=1033008 RepID=A0AAD7EKQ7_9AGAR|nr:hypothetical protein DFH08DRAFT_1022809 [Mycena albidolilacea]
MSTSLPPLDSTTGAPLIGTWASSLLYTAEMLQAVSYFRKFKDDDLRLKTLVTVAFAIDTVSVLADYACVYLYTITHAGHSPVHRMHRLCRSPSPKFPGIQILAFVSDPILQPRGPSNPANSSTNNTIVVVLLSMLILVAFGGTLVSGLGVVLFPAFKDRRKVRVAGTVWLVTQVSVDLIIAGAFVYQFQKAKSKFLKGRRRIHNTLNRLVVLTIQTGSATAVIAVAALITFLIDVESNVPTGIMYIVGRIYVLTMLLNLNIRGSVNEESSQGTSRIATSGRDRDRETIAFVHGAGTSHTDDLGGVQFRRAIVHIDSRQDSNGTFKSSSTRSHTAEDPPAEIEVTATDSSKKQSELLVV